MTAHRTAGQLRALRELCALARTGLDVADVLAARGAEDSDVPRNYLLSLERWARGEESGPKLAARTRAMRAWSAALRKSWDAVMDATPKGQLWPPMPPVQSWCRALHCLDDARDDLSRNPGHDTRHSKNAAANFAFVLMTFAGEPAEAAKARVAAMLDRHRKAVGEERARAAADARLRQAKADKVTAERALGTLPGMETT